MNSKNVLNNVKINVYNNVRNNVWTNVKKNIKTKSFNIQKLEKAWALL